MHFQHLTPANVNGYTTSWRGWADGINRVSCLDGTRISMKLDTYTGQLSTSQPEHRTAIYSALLLWCLSTGVAGCPVLRRQYRPTLMLIKEIEAVGED